MLMAFIIDVALFMLVLSMIVPGFMVYWFGGLRGLVAARRLAVHAETPKRLLAG